MKNFKDKWRLFFHLILDPWTLVLTISVTLLFYFSIKQQDPVVSSLFFVLITASSAVWGGRITKHWAEITEQGVLITRGKSAVRSLKLLLRNISSLEYRINSFTEDDELDDIARRNLEEVIERCNLLQENAVNSIEDWTDILPDADIETQIGEISQQRTLLAEQAAQLQLLKSELSESKDSSDDEKKSLKSQIREKESEISNLKTEISSKSTALQINPRVSPSTTWSTSSSTFSTWVPSRESELNTESFKQSRSASRS